jgi:hypothetical protein
MLGLRDIVWTKIIMIIMLRFRAEILVSTQSSWNGLKLILKSVIVRRMASSGMLRRVAFVRIDVSAELSASFITVTRIGELVTTLAVTSNRRKLYLVHRFISLWWRRYFFSETSVLTRATRCNIPEDGILHTHRRENLKSYIALTGWSL